MTGRVTPKGTRPVRKPQGPATFAAKRAGDKVCVAWITHRSPEPQFVKSLVNLCAYDARRGGHVMFGGAHLYRSAGTLLAKRNQVVRDFLALDGIDWCLLLDDDMTFDPDLLERLLAAADAKERPIVGGLCFSMMHGDEQQIVPTLYGFRADGDGLVRGMHYPPDQLTPVAGTGAACLLVHRRVFESIRDAKDAEGKLRFPPPWPWFADMPTATGDAMSEDLVFCLRAGALGFPVHVDTRAKTGHVKNVTIDEPMYLANVPQHDEPAPTYVVIPVKDRHDLTQPLLDQLAEQGGYEAVFVYDNGSVEPAAEALKLPENVEVIDAEGLTIHEMWNAGILRSLTRSARCNVAILNNDLILGDQFLEGLAWHLRLRQQVLAVCPNYDGRTFDAGMRQVVGTAGGRNDGTGGMSGFAFMVKGEAFAAGLPKFDENLKFWYGDDDLTRNIEAVGGAVCLVRDITVEHIGNGSQTSSHGTQKRLGTPELERLVAEDKTYFEKKWGLA